MVKSVVPVKYKMSIDVGADVRHLALNAAQLDKLVESLMDTIGTQWLNRIAQAIVEEYHDR